MNRIQKAGRLKQLPPYLFVMEIDRLKAEVRPRGWTSSIWGWGDPDLPTPDHILKTADPGRHWTPGITAIPPIRG